MTQINYKLVFIIFVFVVGIFAETACFNSFSSATDKSVSSDSPILSFCELVNNPEKYDGNTVRVSATVNMMNIHGYMIFDSAKCSTKENNIAFGAVMFSRD